MVSELPEEKFNPTITRGIIGLLNSYAALTYRPQRIRFVSWANRIDRECSKIATLARPSEWQKSRFAALRMIWYPAEKLIRFNLVRRVNRHRGMWNDRFQTISKSLRRQVRRKKIPLLGLLWETRACVETNGTSLRARTYAYNTREKRCLTWSKAVELATQSLRRASAAKAPYMGRYIELWELCFRYNVEIQKHQFHRQPLKHQSK